MSSLPLTCRKLMRRHHNRLLTRTWEAGRVGTGSGVCGAVREMEVGWPSGASLRGAASKHRALRPLRRFVVSGTEKARCQRVSWGPCEHERGKRGNDGRSWRSRGLRCWTSDGGCLALRSRRADGGSKPPRGALVNDRRLERRGKSVKYRV